MFVTYWLYIFFRDNINTDIYGANIFNKFLKESRLSPNTNIYDVETCPELSFCESMAQSCVSILVETGVHQTDSNFLVHHSHRDFLPIEKSLCKPTLISENVSQAIESVLKLEKFK